MTVDGAGPDGALDAAEDALRGGLVVAIPTDTVYGLAADPRVAGATGLLFTAKRRPDVAHLPVLVPDGAAAEELGELPPGARRVAGHYWPGPVTIVVPRAPASAEFDLRGDSATIGLRCPDHAVAQQLLGRVGALAVTSANLHGSPPLTTAADVRAELGDRVAVIVDGGTCDRPPSCVVTFTLGHVRLLRAGAVPFADIEALDQAGDDR